MFEKLLRNSDLRFVLSVFNEILHLVILNLLKTYRDHLFINLDFILNRRFSGAKCFRFIFNEFKCYEINGHLSLWKTYEPQYLQWRPATITKS